MNPLDLLYGARRRVARRRRWPGCSPARPAARALGVLRAVRGSAAPPRPPAAAGRWSTATPSSSPLAGARPSSAAPCSCRPPAWPGCSSPCSASSRWRIAWYAPRYHQPGRGTAPLPGRLQPGPARLPGRAGRRRHGDLPGRLGDHEPGVLPADPAPPAQRRLGPRRVLVPGPVRDRLPAGRGRVRDPVLEDARHRAGRDRRPGAPGRPAAGGPRPTCSPWPGSGSRPGSSRCTSGCPRRTRSRPPTGPAFLSGVVVKLGVYGIALFAFRLDPAGRGLARPGHDGRRGAHRRHRHPVRDARNATSSGSWPTPRSRTSGSS